MKQGRRRSPLLCASTIVLLCAAGCSGNVTTATYANMSEARTAVDQGLVPRGLPASSFEMRAAYTEDDDRRWGIINFPAEGAGELRTVLAPEEISLAGIRVDIPPRVEWWPVQLRQSLDDERVKATGAKAYRAKTGDLIFVVNWPQGRAYYFTPR